MAFALANFAPIGGQGGRGAAPQMFSYRTTDASTAIDAAGYFNTVNGLLQVGDLIYAVDVDDVDTPTAITSGSLLIVNSITAAGVVDTTNATVLVVTDSD